MPPFTFYLKKQQQTLFITHCSEKQNRSNMKNCCPIILCTECMHPVLKTRRRSRDKLEKLDATFRGPTFNMPTCHAESRYKWSTPFVDWLMSLFQELKTTPQPQVAYTVTSCSIIRDWSTQNHVRGWVATFLLLPYFVQIKDIGTSIPLFVCTKSNNFFPHYMHCASFRRGYPLLLKVNDTSTGTELSCYSLSCVI